VKLAQNASKVLTDATEMENIRINRRKGFVVAARGQPCCGPWHCMVKLKCHPKRIRETKGIGKAANGLLIPTEERKDA